MRRGRQLVYDFQSLIFREASNWSAGTSLAVFFVGLLYTLQGFRFARILLPVAAGGGGLVIGAIVAGILGLSATSSFLSAAVFGVVALLYFRFGLVASSAFTFGVLAQYLGRQCGLTPDMSIVVGLVGFVLGIGMFWLYRLHLPMIVTILIGSGLLVTGFVGIAMGLAPSLGGTFIDWAERLPLLVPVLLIMLWTLGYSVQGNARQGEMQTGGSPDIQELQAR
jgi:hypothetical protein